MNQLEEWLSEDKLVLCWCVLCRIKLAAHFEAETDWRGKSKATPEAAKRKGSEDLWSALPISTMLRFEDVGKPS